MLSRKLFRWAHKIALFAIVFASLAPSISHALAYQNGTQGFMQEICGVGGQKLYIQVVTTQGQAIETALESVSASKSRTINHHLNHCPFCQTGVFNVVIPNPTTSFELYISQQLSEQRVDYQIPFVAKVNQSAHLSRGPPSISL
jgi:hypothetical protein